jgi:hypothetical protein
MFYIILRNTTIFLAGTKVWFGLGRVWNLQRILQQNPNAESNVGTPLTSLGPASVANSLRPRAGEAYDEQARGLNLNFWLTRARRQGTK